MLLICCYHSDAVIIANVLLVFLLDESAASVVRSGDDYLLSRTLDVPDRLYLRSSHCLAEVAIWPVSLSHSVAPFVGWEISTAHLDQPSLCHTWISRRFAVHGYSLSSHPSADAVAVP